MLVHLFGVREKAGGEVILTHSQEILIDFQLLILEARDMAMEYGCLYYELLRACRNLDSAEGLLNSLFEIVVD